MRTLKKILLSFLIIISIISASSCSLISPDNSSIDGGESYDIGSEHFALISTTKELVASGSAIRVAFSTDISIYSHTAKIKLVDSSDAVIKEQEISESVSYAAGDTISHYIEIDDAIEYKAVKLTVSAKSYDNPEKISLKVPPRVTFYVGSDAWATAYSQGAPILCPDMPTEDGQSFCGWYLDTAFTSAFDFSAVYTKDTPVYAKMSSSADSLTNTITTTLMPSIVTIRTTLTKYSGFQKVTTNATSSGFVIKSGADTIIMTNCHSVQLQSGYTSISIIVEDYLGNQYDAEVLTVDGKRAIAAEYDLALLRVADMKATAPIPFADKNAEVGDTVISLGSPAGQKNAITFGQVRGYGLITIDIDKSLSDVTFPVLQHTSPIAGGSSGGAVLDGELRLIGVNFAGADGDSFTNGYAIPIERTLEFLATYLGS